MTVLTDSELAMKRLSFGSLAAARAKDRRRALVQAVAGVLADGGPIQDEVDAAEQVIEAIERFLTPEPDTSIGASS